MGTGLVPYTKPYLSSEALCEKLKQQGLKIEDQAEAEKILKRYSYYRFKAYLIPFKNNQAKNYQGDASFENGHSLYNFDSELRSTLFTIIEQIEVGVRSNFDQWVSFETDNPFWYLDSSMFKVNGYQINTVANIGNSFRNSKEEFSKHYRKKYYNEYCPFYRDLPPGWIAIEIMTFGNLVKLLENVADETVRKLKLDRFTKKTFGIKNFSTLRSWLKSIHQVRNNCGHHSRVFNRNMIAPAGIKGSLSKSISLVKTNTANKSPEDQLNRLYTTVAAMQVIYQGLGYKDKLGPMLKRLFEKYPIAKKFEASMGFPELWVNEPLLF